MAGAHPALAARSHRSGGRSAVAGTPGPAGKRASISLAAAGSPTRSSACKRVPLIDAGSLSLAGGLIAKGGPDAASRLGVVKAPVTSVSPDVLPARLPGDRAKG